MQAVHGKTELVEVNTNRRVSSPVVWPLPASSFAFPLFAPLLIGWLRSGCDHEGHI